MAKELKNIKTTRLTTLVCHSLGLGRILHPSKEKLNKKNMKLDSILDRHQENL